jgi:hypothetical protein
MYWLTGKTRLARLAPVTLILGIVLVSGASAVASQHSFAVHTVACSN